MKCLLTICDLAVTLNFDLLISKSISVSLSQLHREYKSETTSTTHYIIDRRQNRSCSLVVMKHERDHIGQQQKAG